MDKYQDDSLMLHTDLYLINMLETYWRTGMDQRKAVFEVFFRKNPFENGYVIFAGLERVIQYLRDLRFTESDIDYLRETGLYQEDFLDYLAELDLNLTIHSMEEGELCFASEPLMQVEGPLDHCQIVQTAILNIIN